MSLSFNMLAEGLEVSNQVKRLGKKFGLNVILVDPMKVRSKSIQDEEFGDYWINSDSNEVGEDNVWISAALSTTEIEYAVEQAWKRLSLESSGVEKWTAYERALKATKAHREKSEKKFLKSQKSNKVYVSKLGTMTFQDGIVSIWLVNGRLVRDLYRTDFVEGGHDIVYGFISDKEIWIDDKVPAKERKFIIKHESDERRDMKSGMKYQSAHERAAMAEFDLRKQEGL